MVKSIFIHKLENSYQVEVVNIIGESKFLLINEVLEEAIEAITTESLKQPTERELTITEKEEKLQMATEEKNAYFKLLAERISGIFTDEEIIEKIEAFPFWSGEGEIHKYGEYYRYGEKLYKVIHSAKDGEGNEIGFTTQESWTPDVAVSLYVEVLPPDVIPDWIQPTGSHNAYPIDFLVRYDNKIWKSKIVGNTTIPGSDPRWWEMIEDLDPEDPEDPTEEPTGPQPWVDRWALNGGSYDLGDEVTHNGFIWKSKIAANTYEPAEANWSAWDKIGAA